MADKQAVTEIVGKLGWAYDENHLDYFAEVFADDGRFTMSIAGQGQVGDFQGKDTIMGLYRGAKEAQANQQRRHVVTNLFFTDESDTAVTAISYLTLIVNEGGAMKLTSTGLYTDRFVLVNGAWRLAHRDLKLDAPY